MSIKPQKNECVWYCIQNKEKSRRREKGINGKAGTQNLIDYSSNRDRSFRPVEE
jgi:hypothetical protein